MFASNVRISILAFLLLSLVAGCDLLSSIDQGGNTGREDILPLAVGNEWIMRTTNEFKDDGHTDTYVDTIRVVSDTTIQSETWYEVHIIGRYESFLATNREDGLWKWQRQEGASPHLAYKYPVKEGESYRLTAGEEVRVPRVDTTVVVPAGSFSSVYYRALDEQVSSGGSTRPNAYPVRNWLKPGQGYVRQVIPYVIFSGGDSTNLAYTKTRELVEARVK